MGGPGVIKGERKCAEKRVVRAGPWDAKQTEIKRGLWTRLKGEGSLHRLYVSFTRLCVHFEPFSLFPPKASLTDCVYPFMYQKQPFGGFWRWNSPPSNCQSFLGYQFFWNLTQDELKPHLPSM
jgi:hypothetical protein